MAVRPRSSAPGPAWAHQPQGQAAGFLAGLRHPVSGLDHVLAMVSVGLWGAQLGPPAIWLLPVTFPLVMAFGGFLGLLGVPLPGVEVGIALSALLLGLMVAREARPPLLGGRGAGGVLRRLPRPRARPELPAGQSALLYSLGFVVATGCLHARGHRHRPRSPLGLGARSPFGSPVPRWPWPGAVFVWRAAW